MKTKLLKGGIFVTALIISFTGCVTSQNLPIPISNKIPPI